MVQNEVPALGGQVDGKRKSRLGKGLGALLGEYLPAEGEGEGFRTVAVATITPNPFQPRRAFAASQLLELENSIRENGLLQPLVVRPARGASPDGAVWELVAGERRWRAVRRLGWTEVPVVVREIDDRTLLVLAIVENVQRADLSPLEEAEGYRQLISEFGFTQKEVAENVGRERSTIANMLRLLQLPPSVQRLVSEGALSMGHARALLGLSDEQRMVGLARRAANDGLSVRAVEALVRQTRTSKKKPKERKPRVPRDPHVRRLELELQRQLGTEVRINLTNGHVGRIEIPFYSVDDFGRLTDVLLGAEVSRL